MDEDLVGYLNPNNNKRRSKFINHFLNVDEVFEGIYTGAKPTHNRYGRTIHYYHRTDDGREVIFDNHNPRIAKQFIAIPFNSRVRIKKFYKEGLLNYDIQPIKAMDVGSLDI